MKRLFKTEATILLLMVVFIGLIALSGENLPGSLALLRLTLALGFIVLAPGYALQSALFPRWDELSGPERLALSICLSLGLIPILAMILNYLPWGIDLWPIVIAETICVLVFTSIAVFRRSRDRGGMDPQSGSTPGLIAWWVHQDRRSKVLLVLLSMIFLLTTSAMVGFSLLPDPGNEFTEFYLLGPDRAAEGFPQSTTVGKDMVITLGLVNHQRQTETYRVELWAQDIVDETRRQQVAAAGPFVLEPGETLEQAVTWQMPWAGDDQQAQFLLFRGAGPEPTRSLRLWIDVRPARQ